MAPPAPLELELALAPPAPPPLELLLLVVSAMPYAGVGEGPVLHAADSAPVVSPSSTATAARGNAPSLVRRGSPQLGHVVSKLLAWQAQLGQRIKAGGMRR